MAIAFVQHGAGINTSGTSATDAFTASSGSLLVIGIRVGATGRTVTVSDNLNGSWTQAATQQQTTDGHQAYIFYVRNAAAGTTTVTVSISGVAATIRSAMAEYSGVLTASDPLDKTSTNQGTSNSSDADSLATATTTQAGELLFGLNTNDNSTNAAWVANIGGGGTVRQTIAAFQVVAISDLTVSATGAYHNDATFTGTNSWTSLIATFKASAASGTVYTKTGAGVAKLYATGARGGHVVWIKTGAGVAKLYATGAKSYVTSGYLTTTLPVVPFRQQFIPGVYTKTGSGITRLYATGAKQYLIGGTGTLYQKTGTATGGLFDTGDSQRFYAKSGTAFARLYVTGARTGGTIPPPPTPPLYVLTNAVFTVAGIDLSNHVDSLEVLVHQDMIDITKYGDTATHWTLGLRTDQMSATFIQDFGLSTVHSVISSLLASSGFVVTAKPRSGITAVTNPLYSATCIIVSYTPLSAKVGDRSDAPVVFQAITPITQALS